MRKEDMNFFLQRKIVKKNEKIDKTKEKKEGAEIRKEIRKRK